MVNLVPTPEDIHDLDDGVAATLRSAAVLALKRSNSRKGKGKFVQAAPRHIVFINYEGQAKLRSNLTFVHKYKLDGPIGHPAWS
ncbi:hypothetical protein RSAG8_06042, partial [Rhizoctonia solani AG-8 WAC10335]